MSDGQELWSAVDAWVETRFLPADAALEGALAAADEAGLPAIQVSAAQGRLLELLVRIRGARSVLEVGTLGGYSTIWLARGLSAGGTVLTLEIDPRHAEVARGSLERAGLADTVEVRVGPAADSLAALTGSYDVVFIDADKASTPDYVTAALRLSHPGTVIVVDNVVRGGAVADEQATDPGVLGVRAFADLVAREPRVRATAIQTVGRKGHDGFAVLVVDGDPGSAEGTS